MARIGGIKNAAIGIDPADWAGSPSAVLDLHMIQ